LVVFKPCFNFFQLFSSSPQAVLLYLVYSWETSNQFVTSQAERDTRGDYLAPTTDFVPLPAPI
jgi:hypothetical protein